MLLVGLGGLAHLVASLADEASSLRFSVMVSTSSWCVAISPLVMSSFVLLQLSFCSKLLAALEGGKIHFSSNTVTAGSTINSLNIYSLEDKVSCHPLHVLTDEIEDWPKERDIILE